MQTEKFTVRNVKCAGCASAIQDGLKPLPGVEDVQVSVESGEVTVSGSEISREAIAAKLTELGYPLA